MAVTNNLFDNQFISVGELEPMSIPEVPGLYRLGQGEGIFLFRRKRYVLAYDLFPGIVLAAFGK